MAPASPPPLGAYCVQRAAAGPGQAVLPAVPRFPAPVPRQTSPTTGEEVGEMDEGKKSWLSHRLPTAHLRPSGAAQTLWGAARRTRASGAGSPSRPAARCRVGELGKPGKQPPSPPLANPYPASRWRGGRRRLLYIIAGGQVGCFF